MAARTARTVLSGPSSLRSHLQTRASSIRRAPCLIVASDLPPDEQQDGSSKSKHLKSFRQTLSDNVNRTGFTMSMELGLRTVNCTVTSAYPTWGDVEGGVEMARRVGATTVVGVGAGAALDCAKAVASALLTDHSHHVDDSNENQDAVELILAPSTLGGTMAAMSSSSLLLSTAEEALLPPYLACTSEKGASPADFAPVGATVCLDGDNLAFVKEGDTGTTTTTSRSMTVATPTDAALASLTICVESSILLAETISSVGGDEVEVVHTLLEGARSNAMATLEAYRDVGGGDDDDIAEAQKVGRLHAAAAVAHAAQLLRYGDSTDRRRSISMALVSSLLPRYFPHGHALTFMASLLPGLCESTVGTTSSNSSKAIQIGEQEIHDFRQWSAQITNGVDVPKLVAMAEGTPDVSTLMRKVDGNSALLGCEEIGGYDLVEDVLHRSLNR